MATISKPKKAIFNDALAYAEQIREGIDDPHSLAHIALYLAERNQNLEAIYRATEAYMRFGQDAQLHAELTKALEKFEQYELDAEQSDEAKLGLSSSS